jgi:hypothetical protein
MPHGEYFRSSRMVHATAITLVVYYEKVNASEREAVYASICSNTRNSGTDSTYHLLRPRSGLPMPRTQPIARFDFDVTARETVCWPESKYRKGRRSLMRTERTGYSLDM